MFLIVYLRLIPRHAENGSIAIGLSCIIQKHSNNVIQGDRLASNFTSHTSVQLTLNFPLPREGILVENVESRVREYERQEWFEPLELLGVPASSIPFYSPRDFCETLLRLHSIRKLLSHPRDKASQFQRLPPLHATNVGAFLRRHRFPPRGTVFNSIYNRTAKYRSGNCWFVAEALLWYAAWPHDRENRVTWLSEEDRVGRRQESDVGNKALGVSCRIQRNRFNWTSLTLVSWRQMYNIWFYVCVCKILK